MGASGGTPQVDRDLVEAARGGDREAYADLIRARGDRLFAIAHRILRDVDRTEDAVQEALVIAWRDLPGLRDPDRFDAWLYRLLVRSCITEAARESPRHRQPLGPARSTLPSPTDDYLSVGDRDQLERGFRRLPPEQRAILVLRHYAGLEPGEIAETLAIRARHGPLTTPPRPSRHACRPRGRRPCDGEVLGMTREREIERVLEAWLEPGPSVMPDRVFDAVLDRIEREPQRRGLRLTRRFHPMTSTLKLVAVTVLADGHRPRDVRAPRHHPSHHSGLVAIASSRAPPRARSSCPCLTGSSRPAPTRSAIRSWSLTAPSRG